VAVRTHSAQSGTGTKRGYVKFIEGGHGYVYDAGSHSIHKLSLGSYRILEDFLTLSTEELQRQDRGRSGTRDLAAAVEPLSRLRRRRVLRPLPRRDYHAVLEPGYLESQLSGQLNQLVLHLTEQCNQRCTYCINSGGYAGEYVHNNKRMTWEIARRCIDYFLPRTHTGSLSGVGFFGGEPLLCWDLIERSVRYVRKSYALLKEMPLTVATNVTLLEPRQLDFLVRNDVGLQVSLDGPREIHDAARVTAAGKGTHAPVIEKLETIRRRYPWYFAQHVNINCLLDPGNDPSVIFQYFNADPFVRMKVAVNPIKEDDRSRYAFSCETARRYQAGLKRIVGAYLASFSDNSDFNYTLFERIFINEFHFCRQMGTAAANKDHPFNLVCLPGVKNLYVSADGTFYPCEQFRCPGCEIGDYRTGFDRDKIVNLLSLMAEFCAERCQHCWAYRLCGHCWLHLLDRGRISQERKAQRCERERAILLQALRRFVQIWESEPRVAFRHDGSLHYIEMRKRLVRSREGKKSLENPTSQ